MAIARVLSISTTGSTGCFSQVNKSCARCRTNYLTPFRCYVVPGKIKCVKCAHDKYPCSFEPETETTSTPIVITPKAKQASSSQSQVNAHTTPTASGSRVPRRPIIGEYIDAFCS